MGQGYPFESDLADREMMRTIERSTVAIYWHADGGPVLHNGSMFSSVPRRRSSASRPGTFTKDTLNVPKRRRRFFRSTILWWPQKVG